MALSVNLVTNLSLNGMNKLFYTEFNSACNPASPYLSWLLLLLYTTLWRAQI